MGCCGVLDCGANKGDGAKEGSFVFCILWRFSFLFLFLSFSFFVHLLYPRLLLPLSLLILVFFVSLFSFFSVSSLFYHYCFCIFFFTIFSSPFIVYSSNCLYFISIYFVLPSGLFSVFFIFPSSLHLFFSLLTLTKFTVLTECELSYCCHRNACDTCSSLLC